MKPLPLDYWSRKRTESLQKTPLKRTAIKGGVNQSDKNVRLVKIRKSKPESLGRLIQRAVTVFHKWIRERDSMLDVFRCISCNEFKAISQMQATHYLPAGNNGVIRLNEHNVNGGCIRCNIELNGNQEAYRVGLIRKIGIENVEALEAMAKINFKWDRVELERIIRKYR